MSERFVLDNSVVMSWVFEDEQTPYSREVLESLRLAQALVPGMWPLEVCNVLLVAERHGRITRAKADKFIAFLDNLPIQVIADAPGEVFTTIRALAYRHKLSSYDASYLRMAIQEYLPLATQDRALKRAAKREGVALYAP